MLDSNSGTIIAWWANPIASRATGQGQRQGGQQAMRAEAEGPTTDKADSEAQWPWRALFQSD